MEESHRPLTIALLASAIRKVLSSANEAQIASTSQLISGLSAPSGSISRRSPPLRFAYPIAEVRAGRTKNRYIISTPRCHSALS